MAANTKLIVNFSSGSVVCERAAIADRAHLRLRGLMGRRSLEVGTGLLLRPAPAIHTWFMRFRIDAVFLDADLKVVRIVEAMRPWRMAGSRLAWAVLELAAGDAERQGIVVGDRLAVADPASLEDDDDPAADELLASAALLSRSTPAAHSCETAGGDPRRGIRVLLVGRDRRFRSVASVLLERRGCGVATTGNAQRVTELVGRHGVDVVVVDAWPALTAAAQTVAMVEAMAPPVGVVLVGDEANGGLHHLPVLPKWGSFEEIFTAVEDAVHARARRGRLVG